MNKEGQLKGKLQAHKGYQQFHAYEAFQLEQERLRTRLGSPVGRSPPLTVSVVSPTNSNHIRSFSQIPKSPKPWKLPELGTPKVRIDISNIKSAILGQTPSLMTRSSSALNLKIHTVPASLPREESYQYAIPNPRDLESFNPFLRPKARNHFFPAELFDLDETDYSSWKFPRPALARWRLRTGEWSWRECQILKYDLSTCLFTIEWNGTKVQKTISRFNVRFPGEGEDDILRRFAEASQRRDLQEAVLRYETRLSLSAQRFPEIVMPPYSLARILSSLSRVMREEDRQRVEEEIHYQHRLSIVNFVFEIEHFITKSRLTAR